MLLLSLNFTFSGCVTYGDYPELGFCSTELQFVVITPFVPDSGHLNSYVVLFGNLSSMRLSWLSINSTDDTAKENAIPNSIRLGSDMFLLQDSSDTPLFFSNTLQNLAVADFTGDGSYDILVGGNSIIGSDAYLMMYMDFSEGLSSYYNGNPGWQPVSMRIEGKPLRDISIAVADVDKNGLYDFLVCGKDPEDGSYKMRLFVNEGPGRDPQHGFNYHILEATSSFGLVGNIKFIDVNNDGMPDIVGYGKFQDGFIGLKVFLNDFDSSEGEVFPFREVARFSMVGNVNRELFDYDFGAVMGGIAVTRAPDWDVYVAVSAWSTDPNESASYLTVFRIHPVDENRVEINELMLDEKDSSSTEKYSSVPSFMKTGPFEGFDSLYVSTFRLPSGPYTTHIYSVIENLETHTFTDAGGDFYIVPFLYTATRNVVNVYGSTSYPSRSSLLTFRRSGTDLAVLYIDSDDLWYVHDGSGIKDFDVRFSSVGNTLFLTVEFSCVEEEWANFEVRVNMYVESGIGDVGLGGLALSPDSCNRIFDGGFSEDYDLGRFATSGWGSNGVVVVVSIFHARNVPSAIRVLYVPVIFFDPEREFQIVSNVVVGWGSVVFSVPSDLVSLHDKPDFIILDPRRRFFKKVPLDAVDMAEIEWSARTVFSVCVSRLLPSTGVYLIEVRWKGGRFQIPFFYIATSM